MPFDVFFFICPWYFTDRKFVKPNLLYFTGLFHVLNNTFMHMFSEHRFSSNIIFAKWQILEWYLLFFTFEN